MGKIRKVLMLAVCLGILSGAVSVYAKSDLIHGYPSSSGALHVEGNCLIDSNGDQIQLKGISTHGIAWYPQYVNEKVFREFRQDWNANVIRLAMYTAEYGGYCTDGDQEQLKQLMREGVKYATEQDLYVIVDWHILSDGNPNTYLDQSLAFFDEMSDEFAAQDNVIYEICNEPNGGTSWEEIKKYAKQVIETIRENDADAVIVVGTPNWSQFVEQAAADPITEYENIMYALHFYAATHKEELRSMMTNAMESGLPVFVTEYGICDASGNGAIDMEQANAWVDLMDSYGISYVAWNLSNKEESSAMLKNSCEKISGFTEEDLSPAGKWLHEMLTGAKSDLAKSVETSDIVLEISKEEAVMVTETWADGNLGYTAVIKNSWESNGEFFYQYDLTISNKSDVKVPAWRMQLMFNEEVQLSDGWNGDYNVQGKELFISAKDYNQEIAAGEEVKEIGFIICGSEKLAIEEGK